jgi:glyoxylase-like metal-dependent hydrolase (beta-lactamase superfamily II)
MGAVEELGNGISVIDSGYLGNDIAAIYFLRQNDQIAIIETGTKHSLPNINKALEKKGLSYSNVSYIIPTHVHLDHAAGAGVLMSLCKNAKLVIHPRGVRHMIDPSKLVVGTKAVYGEDKFNQLYGNLMPIDCDRIIEADDGFILDFCGRELKFIDTPGHARHHFCVWDKLSGAMFTGDTFGVSYREFDTRDGVFIFPTTTPTQFEPAELVQSITKIMEYKPQYLCLTHYGAIKPNKKVVEQLIDSIYYMSNIAKKYYGQPHSEEKVSGAIMQYLLKKLELTGFSDLDFCKEKLANDVSLNTQGLLYWQHKLTSSNQ